MSVVTLEVLHDAWNARKMLIDPVTKKKYFPRQEKGVVFYDVDENYALNLIERSPDLFKRSGAKAPAEKSTGKMSYKQMQKEYTKQTGQKAIGKSKAELEAFFDSENEKA